MDILNTLVPEISECKIADRTYKIGKLTASQTIKLVRYIVKFTTKITKETSEKIKDSKSNVEDMFTLFDFLNEDEIAGVIGILINETDIEFLKANLDVEKLTDVIATICEKTDIKKILGNMQRIAEAVKK